MKIISKNSELVDELLLILKLFYSIEKIKEYDLNIEYSYKIENNKIINTLIIEGKKQANIVLEFDYNDYTKNNLKKFLRRYCKLCLYKALVKITHKKQPWGSLTGIRPTKLFYELIKEYGSLDKAKYAFEKIFNVSHKKAQIVYKTIENQQLKIINNNEMDFYIHIPFCTSKCYYCSFISSPIKECEQFIEPYINALIKEIKASCKIIQQKNIKINNVYIGGGTPTAFSSLQLEKILKEINFSFNEFTVEAGRPDTITKEKLDVLNNYGVTRISINPQTFNDETLKAIGRNHSSNEIYEAFKLAKNYNFQINMDLIAGLNNEYYATFKNSLNKAIKLQPDNITIHTLSVKRTSNLQEFGGNTSKLNEVIKMVNYSYSKLLKCGYLPYYLYKQKYMIGNLENIGYSKINTNCQFNINSMEEISGIIACGANAISKRFYLKENRIERLPNVKNLNDYITRIDELISKKKGFFN